ncbi:Nuclear pore complex protein Nup98-Nup96 [Portunus trituberculatus]|uniref:Nuclear pore complex protein Nup98-Nup96 n=1 Tax=Portunus trituberculatus TaxID=210409 RepID=A0A5B7DJ15_PORTR|nr:Nuclear pore complex protein Nup98-Nup96 [Portunus trituberculatus]
MFQSPIAGYKAPLTGLLVNHFSKYGLQDDNEEEDMVAVPPKQQQQQQQAPTDALLPPQTTTTTTTSSLLPLTLPHKNAGPPVTALTSPPQFSLSYTTTTTTTPALSQAQPPQTRFLESALQDSQVPEDDLLDSVAREPGAIREEPRLHEPRTEYQLLPSGRDEGQELGHMPPQHQATQIPMADSLLHGIQNCVADMGAFMGRSFRVGWGPGWTLAHIGPMLALEQEGTSEGEQESVPSQPSPPPSFLFVGSLASQPKVAKGNEGPRYKVLMEQVHTIQPDHGTISALVEECLACVLQHSILESTEEMEDLSDPTSSPSSPSCPSFRPLKDVELLHQLADTAALHSYQEPALEEILTLCVALWGRLDFYSPETDGESEYSVSRARVEAVSQWLESVSQETVVQELQKLMWG